MATINASSFYKNMLHELVGSIACTDNLLSILKLLPINKLKHFINEQIDELDLNSCKQMYYTQMPIDEIFSADIFQYMLSFAGFYHTKAVNKQWKKYSEKNESQYLTQLYKPINDKNVNNTYIIHKYRKQLHKIEIDLGFKGPLNHIVQALVQSISDDRLLIYDGIYDLGHAILDHNLQIIGIGNAVTIKSAYGFDPWFNIRYHVECNIQNIIFDCSLNEYRCIDIDSNAILNMENCELQFKGKEPGCWVLQSAEMNVNNCRFLAVESKDENAIELSSHAKIANITNCTFKNCNIRIDDSFDEDDDHQLQLKCSENIFDLPKDLYPIRDTSTSRLDLRNSTKYILQNNVCSTNDPNTIHKLFSC